MIRFFAGISKIIFRKKVLKECANSLKILFLAYLQKSIKKHKVLDYFSFQRGNILVVH